MKFHSKPCLIQNPFLNLGCNNIFEQPLSNHLRMRCQSTNKKTSICIPNSRSLIPNSQSPILNLLLNPHSSIFDPQFSIRNIQSLTLNPKRQPPIFNPNHYFNSHSFYCRYHLDFQHSHDYDLVYFSWQRLWKNSPPRPKADDKPKKSYARPKK